MTIAASPTNAPAIPHYIPPPDAQEERAYLAMSPQTNADRTTTTVDYADLAVIDLAKLSTPEGKVKLAAEVRDAMRLHGFFYVINHGYTPEQVSNLLHASSRNHSS